MLYFVSLAIKQSSYKAEVTHQVLVSQAEQHPLHIFVLPRNLYQPVFLWCKSQHFGAAGKKKADRGIRISVCAVFVISAHQSVCDLCFIGQCSTLSLSLTNPFQYIYWSWCCHCQYIVHTVHISGTFWFRSALLGLHAHQQLESIRCTLQEQPLV